jgi:hypothetical protein
MWSANRKTRSEILSTPLTQARKREARGSIAEVQVNPKVTQPGVCAICGTGIKPAYRYCRTCAPTIWRENALNAAKIGRQNTHKPEAQSRRAATQRRQNSALKAWNPASLPVWLNEKFYCEQVQPRLCTVQVPTIQFEICVSEPYALRVRSGKCVPHARHWIALARLVGMAVDI